MAFSVCNSVLNVPLASPYNRSGDRSACVKNCSFLGTRHSNKKHEISGIKRGTMLVQASSATSDSVEKVLWTEKRKTLLNAGLKAYSPQETLRLQKEEGYIILDVRPEAEFLEFHPEGAKNAQVYRLIQDWTPYKILRRAGFAFFGVFNGTEENPDFLKDVAAAGVTPDSKVIVACMPGGTTKPSQNFTVGKESRSLIAAYILVQNGFKNVHHLDGGIYSWYRAELPLEGKD